MTVPIKQKITRKGTGFDAKTWREILKNAWHRAGLFWHRHILRKHFTIAGASEYMYQPRTVRYSRYKAKKFGHRRPLVFSGAAERHAHRTRDLRTSSKGVRVILHLPPYFYQYHKPRIRTRTGKRPGAGWDYTTHIKDPNKAAELRHISQGDAAVLTKVVDREIQRQIDSGQRTVDITAGHRTGAI